MRQCGWQLRAQKRTFPSRSPRTAEPLDLKIADRNEISRKDRGRAAPSAPTQDDDDIAGHAARIIDDLIADVVAERMKPAFPEFVDLQRNAAEGLFPAFLGLVDGPAVVGADMVGKPEHLDGRLAVFDGAIDEERGFLARCVVRQSRPIAEVVEESL